MTQNSNAGPTKTGKDLVVIDPETGQEVATIPEEMVSSQDIIPLNSEVGKLVSTLAEYGKGLPIHLAILESMPLDETAKYEIFNLWDGQETMTASDFLSQFSGQEVPVLGMRIYEHGPFKSKETGKMEPGYYQPQILTGLKRANGTPIVIRTASVFLGTHIFYAARKYGWVWFPTPLKYVFSMGTNKAIYMRNVDAIGTEILRSMQEEMLEKLQKEGGKSSV